MKDTLRLKQFGERPIFQTLIRLNKLDGSIELSSNHSLEFKKHSRSLVFSVKQVKPSEPSVIINK